MLLARNGNVHRNLLALLIAGCGSISTGAICVLAMNGQEIPAALAALAGAALGALCTQFTRSPTTDPPQKEPRHASAPEDE